MITMKNGGWILILLMGFPTLWLICCTILIILKTQKLKAEMELEKLKRDFEKGSGMSRYAVMGGVEIKDNVVVTDPKGDDNIDSVIQIDDTIITEIIIKDTESEVRIEHGSDIASIPFSVGEGKSFFMKNEILKAVKKGQKVKILKDKYGEYKKLKETLGDKIEYLV